MPQVSVRMIGATMLACALAYAANAQTFTVGANFTGSTVSQSGFIPPDTMGAVGPNHVVELVNGRFAVYTKTGTLLTATSLNSFWTSSGAGFDGGFAFDPRVLYDAANNRWFAASVDNSGGANNFLVAVSDTGDPAGSWSGFKVDADTDNGQWADFPTMGMDADGLYLSANMFPVSAGGTSVSILILPKADLLAAAPTVANATLFENLNANNYGYALQPVVDVDNSGLSLPVLSAYNKPAGFLRRTTVTGTINSPTISTGPLIAVTSRSAPPDADQPAIGGPQKQDIDTGDNRFSSNVVLNNGSLWAVHSVNVSGRAALEWYQIRESDNVVLQSGLISDPSLAFYFGAIAVNDFGHVVIAMTGSDASTAAGTYAVVGDTTAGVTTFGTPVQTKAGVDDYQLLDSSGRNRWGDYSAAVIDPEDPTAFWAVQEWVNANNSWAMRFTEIFIDTLPGDTDFDDDVDLIDLSILAVNWHQTVAAGPSVADFDRNDLVDLVDLSTLASNWGVGVASPLQLHAASVPEPSVAVILITAGLTLIRRPRHG